MLSLFHNMTLHGVVSVASGLSVMGKNFFASQILFLMSNFQQSKYLDTG